MTAQQRINAETTPFPRGVQFTPVPNPLLAGLLEQIDDIAELKVTLRVVWALHRKKSSLAYVTSKEMCEDRSVAAMLGEIGSDLERAVNGALNSAVKRGTLLEAETANGERRYLLNTEPVRNGLIRKGFEISEAPGGPGAEIPVAEDQPEMRQGVFKVYEENIGALTPLVAESISEALAEHPESDVIDAIKVAVEGNARSWKYVTAVLRRWAAEGRAGRETDGKPERHSESNRSDEFIERYLERQRARGNR